MEQLTSEEHAAISAARDHLASREFGDDTAAIRDATLALDHTTRRYAELMMDAAVTARDARQNDGSSRGRSGR
jgi:hypothetical protein